jgi:hypothetical protein
METTFLKAEDMRRGAVGEPHLNLGITTSFLKERALTYDLPTGSLHSIIGWGLQPLYVIQG